jgi:hypothetical protein
LCEYKLHLFQHFANNNDGGNGTFKSKTALKTHFHRKHKSFKPAESTQNVPEPHNSVEPARVIQIRGTGSYFDLQNDTPANLTDFFLKLRVDFGTPEAALLLIRSEIETISTQISTTTSKSIITYCEKNYIQQHCSQLKDCYFRLSKLEFNEY